MTQPQPQPPPPKEIILWGAFGQALLIQDAAKLCGMHIAAVFSDMPDTPSPFPGTPVFQGWEGFCRWAEGRDVTDVGFCLGLNSNGRLRIAYHDRLVEKGLHPVTLMHPSAVVAEDAVIGMGSQIMAGVVIGPKANIGKQCIVNASASIDHETVLGDGVEISPGATLCGLVRVGTSAWIAAGATVLPMTTIGEDAVVGAGAVVNTDVPPKTTVVGIPAKPRHA